LVFTSFLTNGQKPDGYVDRDLSLAWVSLNQIGEVVPFVSGESEIALFDVPTLLGGQHLLIRSTENLIDIWVGQRLVLHDHIGDVLIDTISGIDPESGFKVAIYSHYPVDQNISSLIIDQSRMSIQSIQSTKQVSNVENWFLLSITALLLLTGVFRFAFPHSFNHVFSNPLANKIRSLSSEEAYLDVGSFDFIFIVFLFSTFLSTVIFYIGFDTFFETDARLLSILSGWSLVLLTIHILIVAKFIWTIIFSLIYQFSGIPNIQTQDRLYFYIPVLIICSFLSIVDFSVFHFSSFELKNTVLYSLVISEIFFSVWFLLKLDKYYPHKKLLIITYLCGTEFLRGTLALYWLVQLI